MILQTTQPWKTIFGSCLGSGLAKARDEEGGRGVSVSMSNFCELGLGFSFQIDLRNHGFSVFEIWLGFFFLADQRLCFIISTDGPRPKDSPDASRNTAPIKPPMATELLQIDPPELRFVFEVRKQSSSLVQLGNKTDHYIAFKVKTTSPKKYCVRPNMGIIKPNDKCDFTVTMQAQRDAPPDMQCKDKFLIQSTVAPFGATEDDITYNMVVLIDYKPPLSRQFAKDSGRLIEEKKLRVVLISPSSSPVLLPVNGDMKHDPSNEIDVHKDRVLSGVEKIPPLTISEELKGLEPIKDTKEDRADEDVVPIQTENVGDMKAAKDDVQLNSDNESEELKSKLGIMDSKLREVTVTITKLNEERRKNTEEKNLLKKELELLKREIARKRTQGGFPFLFVCMVALISMAVGYNFGYYRHP
ncbi:hypothetical protein V8G54_014957 [Vigna mungo]|uniref:MSP domain-containing protein n=1 Tax=Vigna mungo TaxID=3915 RepID=A0AAQ3RXY6_VIGMU